MLVKSQENQVEENLILNHCTEDEQLMIYKLKDGSYNIDCTMIGAYQGVDIPMSKEQLIEMAKTILKKVK